MEADIMIRNYPLLVATYDPQQHHAINPNYLLKVLKWKTDILPNLYSNSFGAVIELYMFREGKCLSRIKDCTNVFCLGTISGPPAFSCCI